MGKRVVVIASGETERRALPHLFAPLAEEGVDAADVRIPPRHRQITVDVAEKLVRSIWFDLMPRGTPPEKIVVLVDADSKSFEDAIHPLGERIAERVADLPVAVLTTAAKWHLEAWFFADPQALREFLGRDLGSVDPSLPDAIENPKLHLKQLLSRPYLASTAEEIARCLRIAEVRRSPSFRAMEAAIRNGAATGHAPGSPP